jgi:hypothetical protein
MRDTIIVQAMSALVSQIMAAAEPTEFSVPLAPLNDGRIFLGREFLKNRTAPSRIVFVPVSSRFGPADVKSQTVVPLNGQQNGHANRVLRRPIATDRATYEVYCWGQHVPADPERDFDATRQLAHIVVQAAQLLAMSSAHVDGHGEWTDQRADKPQILKAGHEYMFTIAFDMPVLDSGVQFPPAPLTTQLGTVTVS